jgi:hypothetical protein
MPRRFGNYGTSVTVSVYDPVPLTLRLSVSNTPFERRSGIDRLARQGVALVRTLPDVAAAAPARSSLGTGPPLLCAAVILGPPYVLNRTKRSSTASAFE